MTQKNRELLLNYLCMASPYGPKVQYNNEIYNIDYVSALYKEVKLDISDNYTIGISEIRPYLRPISSMTEKEKTQMTHDCYIISLDFEHKTTDMVALWNTPKVIDWLLKYHFDFMGLISKGLAIEVTKENNPYK